MNLPLKAALLAALLGAAQACGPKAPELPAMSRLESYAFDPASPLADRVKAVPRGVLDYFSAEDKRPDYASYSPTPSEKKLLLDYLRLLPPVYEKTFKARCAGIYFISGFIGNGVTNWVIGPDEKVYFYMILNPDAFKKSLSRTLTERERSCFIPRKGWDVRVEAGEKYKGLLYALAHEGTHGLDYAAGITPYTDDTMPAYYRPRRTVAGSFFLRRWEAYSKPRPGLDFPGRERIIFYGLGGGPKLDIGEAERLYKGLLAGGFISLYGARSWAEELAELATFSALDTLGQPYVITLTSPGKPYALKPMTAAGDLTYQTMEYVERI